jgi:hypothetical protein
VKLCLTWLTLTLGNLSSTGVELCICIFFLYRWLLYYHIFPFSLQESKILDPVHW